jgi:hypothetical protein
MFNGRMHYEIPPYQRPYVWNEEDQWAPLWSDVLRVAEQRIRAGSIESSPAKHFLGAVVYESKPPVVGDVTRHLVIDGQQRTTTLQVMIDAVQAIVEERGHVAMAEALEELILNSSKLFAGKPERFKLWPSKNDRDAFAQAMDPKPGWTGEHRILAAHDFFSREARTWLSGAPDVDGNEPPGDESQRAAALAGTLQDGLYLVCINLTGYDDSQLIFETLNDRGTPLLKADLIKNWVFQQGDKVGAEVESWPETHWVDFDDDWWRTEITQGRHSRSRIDIFVQYWLTMRVKEEVRTEQVFRTFTQYAKPHFSAATSAEAFLAEFRRDADMYRSLAHLPDGSPAGSFYRRVIETMELAATSPLLMWLLSANHDVPADQVRVGLNALESWVIRRTLIRMTMKDVNKLMVAILKLLDGPGVEHAGDTIRHFLAAQTADARIWPSDQAMNAELPKLKLYGYIRQGRIRVVLEAVERQLRTQFNEAVALPPKLEIEHVMPQTWQTHWNPEPRLNPEETAARNHRVQTIGNLTLVAKSLNGALSNRPWTDAEAGSLTKGGEAGLGKRSLLAKFSLLMLSKELTNGHPESWTDADIEERSVALTGAFCQVWAGPPAGVTPMAASDAAESDDLPRVEWTEPDLAGFAASSTQLTLEFLDYVANHKMGEPFRGVDVEDSGFVSEQIAGIAGALTRKARDKYGRNNPPLDFVKLSGQWHYQMDPEVAVRWCKIRA